MRHKVLFRAGWKHVFYTPGFKERNLVSDWVNEIRCAVKAEWKFIFLWFYDFLFFILLFIVFYVLN